jgi:hypothetical protein
MEKNTSDRRTVAASARAAVRPAGPAEEAYSTMDTNRWTIAAAELLGIVLVSGLAVLLALVVAVVAYGA